jgi:phage terminase large subunit-like protein
LNKSLQKYIDENYSKLSTYIDEVLNNKVVAGELEKLAVKRFVELKEKYIYKEEEVKRVIKFFFLLNINTGEKFERFQFMPFQVFIIANLYGLFKTPDKKLFRRSYISIGKKNGKTLFNSGLALYSLIFSKELSAHIVFLASSRDQASIALNFLKEVILNSPLLPDSIKVQRNSIFYNYKNSICKIEVRSSDSARIQGGNYSFVLGDEVNFMFDNGELINRSYTAQQKRNNPLQILISTAGYDKDRAAGYPYEQISRNILEKKVENDEFFALIYTLDSEEDAKDPANFRKANPALNHTITLDSLISSSKQAEILPSFRTTFLTDNLNLWTDDITKVWIEDSIIKERMKHNKQIPLNSDVYIGCDLSAVKDLTSVTVLYYDEEKDEFLTEFYSLFPNSKETKKGGNVDFQTWIDEGYIIQTPDKAIMDEDVIKVISEIKEKYNIISVGVDRWMADKLKIAIENQLNLEVNKIAMDMKYLSTPSKEIEKAIILNKMHLQKSPLIRYCFRNVDPYVNGSGNLKLNKVKNQPIDPIIALSVAMHEFLAFNYGYNQNQAYDEYINSEYMKGTNDK